MEANLVKCPECKSEHIRKNGMRRGKQNHICVNCDRQFVENPKNKRGYSDEIRKTCLKMYLNGMGFRGIERATGVHHTTVINWVKQVGKLLPDAYNPEVTVSTGERKPTWLRAQRARRQSLIGDSAYAECWMNFDSDARFVRHCLP